MPSAIDMFREQREAAEQLHGRVQEISALLDQLRHQINSLALNDELRAVLRQEQDWLTRAQLTVSEVRSFREQDMLRFWPGVVRRWTVALVFALASAGGRRRGVCLVDQAIHFRTRGSSREAGIRGFRRGSRTRDDTGRAAAIRRAHEMEIAASVKRLCCPATRFKSPACTVLS